VPIPNAKELDQDLVYQTTQSILNWRTNHGHEWRDGTVSTTKMVKNVAASLAPDNDHYQRQEPNDHDNKINMINYKDQSSFSTASS
jgi:hypothetical protein